MFSNHKETLSKIDSALKSSFGVYFISKINNNAEKDIITQKLIQGKIKQPVFLFKTSGVTSLKQKWIIHSKNTLFTSAKVTNEALNITSTSNYLCPLSLEHIAGFMCYLRCHVAGAKLTTMSPWSIDSFKQKLKEHQITHVSLVPKQVGDIINQRLKAPALIKCTLVGGGHLNHKLFKKLKGLGWKPMLSYGMTEAASSVAYLKDINTGYKVLSHITNINTKPTLSFNSASAAIGTINTDGKLDFFNGSIKTMDLVELSMELPGEYITKITRTGSQYKCGGKLYCLDTLISECSPVLSNDQTLVFLPHPEWENTLFMVQQIDPDPKAGCGQSVCLTKINNLLTKHKIKAMGILYVNKIPKSNLNKVKRTELIKALTFSTYNNVTLSTVI